MNMDREKISLYQYNLDAVRQIALFIDFCAYNISVSGEGVFASYRTVEEWNAEFHEWNGGELVSKDR